MSENIDENLISLDKHLDIVQNKIMIIRDCIKKGQLNEGQKDDLMIKTKNAISDLHTALYNFMYSEMRKEE